MGLPRVLIGTLCILWMPTETGAMLGITLGMLVPAAVGWWVLRRGRVPGETSDDHRARPVIRETILGSLALLAFFVLSNTDIVIARNVLDSHQAGLAGGLILTKAVLFLPQFVVVVAFPSMSTVEQRRTTLRSLALVSLLRASAPWARSCCREWRWCSSEGSSTSTSSPDCGCSPSSGPCWPCSSCWSTRCWPPGHAVGPLVGAAVAGVLVASLWVNTLGQLVTAVTIIDALLFATLLALSLWRMRTSTPRPRRPRTSTSDRPRAQ